MVSQVTELHVREPLCRIDQIEDGGAFEAHAELAGERESLLLLRAGEVVRGFLNICPHAGRPLNWAPGRFLVEQGMVVCAAHGAGFAIPGGNCLSGPCRGNRLREVAVELIDGAVYLAG